MSKNIKTTQQTMILRLQREDDLSVWEEFNDFYWEVVTGWAREYGCDASLAQEVFQEVYISLFKNFNYDLTKGKFRPWLKTLVKRRTVDAFRRETKQKYIKSQSDYHSSKDEAKQFSESDAAALADQDTIVDTYSDSMSAKDDQVWLQSLLSQAMRNLYKEMDPIHYKSFTMYVLDGLPVNDVAKALEISVDAVYQHRTRFLNNLEVEFVNLLRNIGDSELGTMENESIYSLETLIDQRLKSEGGTKTSGLKSLLADCISQRRNLRGTLIVSLPPDKLTGQVKYVQGLLKQNPKNNTESSALLYVKENLWIPIKQQVSLGSNIEGEGTFKITENSVSGLHATFVDDQKGVKLKDENSTNGTFLNGEKVSETYLKDGDIIQLSQALLVFVR